MATSEQALDPFALPATTDSRFLLLIAAVIGATTYIYGALALQLPSLQQGFLDAALNCGSAAREGNAAIIAALQSGADVTSGASPYALCTADVQIASALGSLSGLPLLLLLTFAIYWLTPLWLVRRRSLAPLDPEDAAEVLEALEHLATEMGLRSPPTYLGAPGAASTGALAFGRPGRRCVALDAALVTLFYTHPARFAAIVRHELAHIRNADVDKAYLTVSVTLAFAVVGLLPLFATFVGRPLHEILAVGARALGLALLVALSAAAVLRAREHYADLRAATSGESATALSELFAAAPAPPESRWRRPLRLHPLPSERRAVLGDPAALFGITPLEVVGAGVAAAIVLPRIISIVSDLAIRSNQVLIGALAAAMCLAPLLVGIVGVAIWRAALARRSGSPVPTHSARVALGVAAGLVLGGLFSFDAYVELLLLDAVGLLVLQITWGLLVGAVVFACVHWQTAASEVVLADVASTPVRRSMLIGLGAMTVVLLAAGTVLFFTGSMASAMAGSLPGVLGVPIALATALFLTLAGLPLLSGAALVVIWAYPLLLLRGRPSLRGALMAAAVGGAVYVVADLVLDRRFHELPAEVRATEDARLDLLHVAVLTSLVIQAAVAGVVAWSARERKLPLAQLAAFVVGCVALVAFTLIHADGVDLPYLTSMYVQIVAAGGLVALLAGGLAAALTSRSGAQLDPRLVRV